MNTEATETSWLDENGRHKALDLYLEQWEGWTDLLDQFADETGVTREEASQMVMIPSIRGIAQRVDTMMEAFNQMVEGFNLMSKNHYRMAQAYHAVEEASRESHASDERCNEIAERMMDLAEREIKESDGDAPWKDPG